MPRTLCTWELGAGLGHLLNIRRVAAGLVERGHEVCIAARQPDDAARVFADLPVRVVEAPHRRGPHMYRLPEMRTMAEVLHNIGFGDIDDLTTLTSRWRTIIEDVKPDAIMINHSPTAMLAARRYDVPIISQGNGFLYPRWASPLPTFHASLPLDEEAIRHEQHVLENANTVLAKMDAQPLATLADLFRDVDRQFLTTVAEFDPYHPRAEADYCGVWPVPGGVPPDWPSGEGKRLFVYVSARAVSDRLFAAIRHTNRPTLVFWPFSDAIDRNPLAGPSIRFESRRIDLSQALREADLCITSGAATSEESALAGTPMLRVPTQREQFYTGVRMAEQGCSLIVSMDASTDLFTQAINHMANEEKYTSAARQFAKDHENFDPDAEVKRVIDVINALVKSRE